MAPELALGGVQRWLQTVIVHPGSVDEALAARGAAALVPAGRTESVVLPSAHLTAPGRVGVYHGMYLARMREALESDVCSAIFGTQLLACARSPARRSASTRSAAEAGSSFATS